MRHSLRGMRPFRPPVAIVLYDMYRGGIAGTDVPGFILKGYAESFIDYHGNKSGALKIASARNPSNGEAQDLTGTFSHSPKKEGYILLYRSSGVF